MESMVMKLLRQLIELGVFGKSWVPILSKKYLIGIVSKHLSVSRNDGPSADLDHESFDCTHLVTLKVDGSVDWGNVESFGEHELEQVLQALVDVYPPELKELNALGFSSMQWPNLPRLIEKLDTLSIREAIAALIEKGFFLVEQFPMITDDKQFAVFYSRTPQLISICKNDGDITQHTVPGMLGGVGGFTRICHLRGDNVIWTHDGYGTKHVEDVLNELYTKFVASQNVDPLAGLGRGLTAEASAKLFQEQNPHLFPVAELSSIQEGGNSPIFALFNQLVENGVFSETFLEVHATSNWIAFFDRGSETIHFCKAESFEQTADNRIARRIQEGVTWHYDRFVCITANEVQYYLSEEFGDVELVAALRDLVRDTTIVHDREGNLLVGKAAEEYIRSMREGKGGLIGRALRTVDRLVLGNEMKSTEPDGAELKLDPVRRWETGVHGYIPRERFNDVEDYISHLERVIQLGRMTSAEFMEDARRSGEELEQMYHHRMEPINPLPRHPHVSNYLPQVDTSIVDDILRDPGTTIFHYIPQADEPSPFGPEQENYVDNPWVVWKNQQEGYDAQHQGSTVLLREALIEQLKAERYRSQVDRRDVPFELQTSSGKLSLGYVIHIRYSQQLEWEEAHNYGVSKIKEFNQSR